MPFEQFDRSRLNILPLSERRHDITLAEVMDPDGEIPPFADPALDTIADAVVAARRRGAAVIVMYGAHVIRRGNAAFMIRLMERGLVTHFAANGAGAIHDFELSMIGATCESVEKYISEGQFGLWSETGRLNDAVNAGAAQGLGFGESAGKYIAENGFPHADKSVLAAGYRLHVPVTVHVGVGSDIVHEHPNCDGAAMGAASYTDFLIYTQSVTGLENGVFLDVGSAVAGPEVYLKALAMARNVARQRGETIAHFTTAVFDLMPIAGDFHKELPKTEPAYYFRPRKTILIRTVADGGHSHYFSGDHRATFPALWRALGEKVGETA